MIFSKIKISNFQGASSVEFTLDASVNTISGANGSGKTTILDAINWCLFGKDYDDKSRFHIHEIKDVGNVSNEPISVEIEFIEAGVQRSVKRLLHGNVTYCFVDGIPCKVGEYSDHIAKLTDGEDRFKLYSNPLYFFGLHWKEQRELLLKFFPEPHQSDVLDGGDFSETFIDELKSRTVEQIAALHRQRYSEAKLARERHLGEVSAMTALKDDSALEVLFTERDRLSGIINKNLEQINAVTNSVGHPIALAAQLQDLLQERSDLDAEKANRIICPQCGHDFGKALNIEERENELLSRLSDVRARIGVAESIAEMVQKTHEMEEQLAVIEENISYHTRTRGNIDERLSIANNNVIAANESIENEENLMREAGDYVQRKTKIIADGLNKVFENLKVVINETLKNGEQKECFTVYRNGIPYEALNTAGQLLCGLELSAFLKSGLGIECPLLIDNGERYVDVDLSKCGQVVVAKALVGEPLKINGRKVKK